MLAAGEDGGHLRHHIAHQKGHDGHGHDGDDGRVQRGADELGCECLALLQIVGQALQHHAEVAALFAGADHADIDRRELARVLCQRLGEGAAAIDFRAQGGQQRAMAIVLGFVGECGEGSL